MREKAELSLGKILVWALIATTLLVTPLWSMDPINPIKMLAVVATGFMGLGVLLANQKALNLTRFRIPLLLVGGFMGWQLIVLFVSGGEMLQQIFGTAGRNTGLITYLAFSILFVVSMVASNTVFLNRFFVASLVVGVASLAYGLVQALGGDPFNWVNPYSPVLGFLGNPNFQSSLLGVLGSIVFAQILSHHTKLSIKVAYGIYLLTTIYVIKETASQQGFLVLLIGSGLALGIYIVQKSKGLGYSYLALGIVGFVSVLFGTLNKGPLASLLYKDSVTYRGDYWRAGWKMTVDNPIFGVGLDSYGDWYRRSRLKTFTAEIKTRAIKARYMIKSGKPPYDEISRKTLCAALLVISGPRRSVASMVRLLRYQISIAIKPHAKDWIINRHIPTSAPVITPIR